MPTTFSVVTPSLNQLAWLKLCAASVADQAGVCVEHIVQDAGTGPELESWAASRPNLRLFVAADQGMYDALNRGLRRATGAICSYLNCDEQYLPGALAKVAAFFDRHPHLEVVLGDSVIIRSDGTPVCYRRPVVPRPLHTRLSHLDVFTCSIFFRKSVVDRGFLFQPQWKVIGDAVWIDQLLKVKVPMAVLPEPLAVYALTGCNLSDALGARPEHARWLAEPDAPPRWLRWPSIVHHRLRKLLAGAYRRRSLQVEVYTFESPEVRKRWTGASPSNLWSRSGAPRPGTVHGQRDYAT